MSFEKSGLVRKRGSKKSAVIDQHGAWTVKGVAASKEARGWQGRMVVLGSLDIIILSMENFKENSTFAFLKLHSDCRVENGLREVQLEAWRPTHNWDRG